MLVAIDVSALEGSHSVKHRVRGIGSYTICLIENLKKELGSSSVVQFTDYRKVSENVELVHFPYFEPFFLSLPKKFKHKSIITIHDLTPIKFPDAFPSGFKGKLKWQVQKRLIKNFDVVLADSQSTKEDILLFTSVKESKVKTVYLGASASYKKIENIEYLNSVKTKYRLPNKFVLYVGDATWNKNLVNLFTAVRNLKVPFIIVGSVFTKIPSDLDNPWNRDLIKSLDIIKSSTDFRTLGYVKESDLAAIYNLATIFTMPSLYEGFGLPILEAMKCGCPVLASNAGSIPEIGGDAIVYSDPNSISEIENNIMSVYRDDQIQRKLSKSGLIQSEKFDWKKSTEEIIKIYKQVLSTKY